MVKSIQHWRGVGAKLHWRLLYRVLGADNAT